MSAGLLRFLAAASPSPCFRESPAFSLCGRQQATRCQRGFHLLREIGVATGGAWQGLDSLRSHLNPPRAWGHSRLIQPQRGPGVGMSKCVQGHMHTGDRKYSHRMGICVREMSRHDGKLWESNDPAEIERTCNVILNLRVGRVRPIEWHHVCRPSSSGQQTLAVVRYDSGRLTLRVLNVSVWGLHLATSGQSNIGFGTLR